jgi:adenylylsulfate kinase
VDGSDYIRNSQHLFMLRDLAKVINSHAHINPNLTSDEIGYRHLSDMYDLVSSQARLPPQFVDADHFVIEPERVVRAFCHLNSLEYMEKALTWDPGNIPLWDRTQRWHTDVAKSSHIAPIEKHHEMRVDNTAKLKNIYLENLPFYERLRNLAQLGVKDQTFGESSIEPLRNAKGKLKPSMDERSREPLAVIKPALRSERTIETTSTEYVPWPGDFL